MGSTLRKRTIEIDRTSRQRENTKENETIHLDKLVHVHTFQLHGQSVVANWEGTNHAQSQLSDYKQADKHIALLLSGVPFIKNLASFGTRCHSLEKTPETGDTAGCG